MKTLAHSSTDLKFQRLQTSEEKDTNKYKNQSKTLRGSLNLLNWGIVT